MCAVECTVTDYWAWEYSFLCRNSSLWSKSSHFPFFSICFGAFSKVSCFFIESHSYAWICIHMYVLLIFCFKLISYSNASVCLLLCRMRISVFWGQEHLSDRLISKRYLKSDIVTWVEKSSTSRAIHARDTGFYWSSENALHEHFIASSGVGVWMKMLQLIAKR